MIILCSLQDIGKYKQQCDEVYTCTIWPKNDSGMDNVGLLAPTEKLVGGYKNHAANGKDSRWKSYAPVTSKEFTQQYIALLDSKMDAIDHWCMEQNVRTVALCCFCPFSAPFCHLDVLEIWLWMTFGRRFRVERKY